MKSFVETVVGGAIGLTALYVVGKVAFQAGYDIAEAEYRYRQLQRGIQAQMERPDAAEPEEDEAVEVSDGSVPEKKQSKLGMLFGLRKALGRKGTSVVGDLLQNPENHVLEACVKGREIHVNVRPRTV